MRVLEQTEITLSWLDADKLHPHPYPTHKRSAGVHLTDILRYIAIQTNQLTDADRDDEMPLRVFLGMAWEQMAARLYPEMIWQPMELERDGIAGSMDGLSLLEPSGELEQVVEEFKYTAKSMRVPGGKADQHKDIRTEVLWMWQVMGYLAMLPGEPTLARLHVCWSRGAYVYPLRESYIRYLIRFERAEIENTWRMVLNHKERAQSWADQGRS